MKNSKSNLKTTKKKVPKCSNYVFCYNKIQEKYCDILATRDDVNEFKVNVKLEGFELGAYTTDFVITLTNGKTAVRETIFRDKLLKPSTIKMLDASRKYWIKKGYTDWG